MSIKWSRFSSFGNRKKCRVASLSLLLSVAVLGLISSTTFLALVAVSAIRYRRDQRLVRSRGKEWPPVTLLKPLCGLEPNLEANLESFFRQDYPAFEIVFGMRDANDPALNIVRSLQKRYPQVPVQISYSGVPKRPN